MNQRYLITLALLLAAVCTTAGTARTTGSTFREPVFVENRGQVADSRGQPRPDILFTADLPGMKLFCRADGLSYVLTRTGEAPPQSAVRRTSTAVDAEQTLLLGEPAVPEHVVYRMDVAFVGASPQVDIDGLDAAPGVCNYYYPHCPSGITGVARYRRVVYRNLYPNIDFVLYIGARGVKYDLVVRPGGDPQHIRLRYTGADSLVLLRTGGVNVYTPLGVLAEQQPYTYQGKREIPSAYRVAGRELRFEVGRYDSSRPLIIDPEVLWSTYYGGTGYDEGNAVATDRDGNIVLTGSTSSVDFPVQNALQQVPGGSTDAIVMSLTAEGALRWATYYGGSGIDGGQGIDVDESGVIAVSGSTASADLPVLNPWQPALNSGRDGFVLTLAADGTLRWATFFGGNFEDTMYGVAFDGRGGLGIMGHTTSTNFPLRNAWQGATNGGGDYFVARFTTAMGQLSWSTYFGGSGLDATVTYLAADGITADLDGNFIIIGRTFSDNFPVRAAFQSTRAGNSDGFISKFNAVGDLLWSTYYGGSLADDMFSATVDSRNNVIVGGITMSTDFPLLNPDQNQAGGNYDGALIKLTPDGQPLWATYCAGSNWDLVYGVACGNDDYIYLTGSTQSLDFPVIDPWQPTLNGVNNTFILRYTTDGRRTWGTYFGGSEYDIGYAIATAPSGSVVVTGVTNSPNMPVVDGLQTSLAGSHDVMLAVFGCDIAEPVISPPGPVQICEGEQTTLRAPAQYRSYRWSNGATTSSISVGSAGVYSVVVSSGIECTSASRPVTVEVLPRPVPEVTGAVVVCSGATVAIGTTRSYASYQWRRDGAAAVLSTAASIEVGETGEYVLTVVDAAGCTGTSATFHVERLDLPLPQIVLSTGTGVLCPGDSVSLSVAGVFRSYRWSNGATSAGITVRTPGVYTVTVVNEYGCESPPVSQTIEVRDVPGDDLRGPLSVCLNSEVDYTVQAGGGVLYVWTVTGGTIIGAADGPAVRVRWDAPGTGLVSVVRRLGECTVVSGPVAVAVADSLRPVIVGPGVVCPGGAIALATADAYSTYEWTGGASSATLTVTEPGVYVVRVRDAAGCSGTSDPFVVEVAPAPVPVLVVDGMQELCPGDTTVLRLQNVFPAYLWSDGSTAATLRVDAPGTYSVRVTNAGGCSSTATVVIAPGVTPQPVVSGPTSLCPQTTVEYTVVPVAGEEVVSWEVNGGTILSTGTTATLRVQWGAGPVGTVRVVVRRTGSACVGETTIEIGIEATLRPVITAVPPVVCPGGTVVLTAPAGYRVYRWSTGETTASISVQTPGVYRVDVEDAGGCSGGTTITVRAAEMLGGSAVVVWTDAAVGSSSSKQVEWTNTGTEVVRVESAGIAGGTPVFALATTPPLPADIPPGGTLVLTCSFAPDAAGDYADSAVVVLSSPCAAVHHLVLQGTAAETPMTVWLPDTTAFPWTRGFRLPVYLRAEGGAPGVQRTAEFEVVMNADVVFPTGVSHGVMTGNRIDGSERVVTVRVETALPHDGRTVVLAELVCDLLLGDDDTSPLLLRRFEWVGESGMPQTRDGLLRLEGICREGGARFLRSPGGFGITVHPHPVAEELVALVEVVEAGECVLELYSADGRREELRRWVHRPGADGAAIVRFDVARHSGGVYTVVLRTPTQTVATPVLFVR